MQDVIITIGGIEYRCVPFFIPEQDLTGVDVYLNETYWNNANSSYLGEVHDIQMPDEIGIDEFTDMVEEWLNGK